MWTGFVVVAAALASMADPSGRGGLDLANRAVLMKNYPPASLKAGEEGSVGFRVELDKHGSTRSCMVTRSSGFPQLDDATCELIVAKARFRAVEQDGRKAPSSHEGVVSWTLPEGAAKAPRAAGAAASGNGDAGTRAKFAGDKLVCKRAPMIGSLVVRSKRCLTRADWERAFANGQREAKDLQTPSGQRLVN